MHAFAEIEDDNDGALYVVPEVVLPDSKILVFSVRAHIKKNQRIVVIDNDAAVATFNDLSSTNAPNGSIAAGDDQ